MNRKLFGLFAVLALLVSCASITKYEPKTESDSLVIGRMVFQCINFNSYGGVSVNGTNIDGIEVRINDLTTGKQTSAYTRINGVFVFLNLDPSHQYQINGLYYKKSEGNSWADAVLYPGDIYIFSPIVGKVESLGSFIGFLDNHSRKGYIKKTNDDVIALFKKYYKDSKWNSYEFISAE